MKKVYYFQHDFEAISDPKMQYVISKFGAVGYGLWWRIVEMLHQDENNRLPLKDYLFFAIDGQMALETDIAREFVECCINEAELLHTDGAFFWSERVLKNVGRMNDVKEKRSQAGKRSAQKRTTVEQNSTSVEQMPASVEENPRKEKKRKEIKDIYPSVDEVAYFFKENGYTMEAGIKAFHYYNEAGWKDRDGKKVKNWKQKMRGVWFKDENKQKQQVITNYMPVN